jgi:cell division protein FtsL
MLKLANGALVIMVLISGGFLYAMEHNTRGLEREIKQSEAHIDSLEEDIKLLNAEWSSLTRPERIQMLAARHLQLAPAEAEQFTTLNQLAQRITEVRGKMQETAPTDAIGDLMKKMQ